MSVRVRCALPSGTRVTGQRQCVEGLPSTHSCTLCACARLPAEGCKSDPGHTSVIHSWGWLQKRPRQPSRQRSARARGARRWGRRVAQAPARAAARGRGHWRAPLQNGRRARARSRLRSAGGAWARTAHIQPCMSSAPPSGRREKGVQRGVERAPCAAAARRASAGHGVRGRVTRHARAPCERQRARSAASRAPPCFGAQRARALCSWPLGRSCKRPLCRPPPCA